MDKVLREIAAAYSGWLAYTAAGKITALFFAALIYLLFVQKQRGRTGVLTLYAAAAGVCCAFPLTAAALMRYQTRFYDYPWVWSVAPVTIVIACAGVLHWQATDKKKLWLGVCAALLFVCGLRATEPQGTADFRDAYQTAGEDLREITDAAAAFRESEPEGAVPVCLWAPSEVLEYARMISADVTLFYGRNLWTPELNAYSFDACTEVQRECYEWMEELRDGASEPEPSEIASYLTTVSDLGVNTVALPRTAQPIPDSDSYEVYATRNYYVICLRAPDEPKRKE